MLKVPRNVTYSMTEEEIEYLNKQAFEISQCPVRSRGRGYAQCLNATRSGAILEFALVHQGAIKNPKEFDPSDRDSYAWDVMWDAGQTEVKRKNFLSNDSTKWYSYNDPVYVKTFLKNLDIVDHFVVGDYKVLEPNVFAVEWMLITKVGKGFKNYMQKSLYNAGQMYYNHYNDRNCQYLRKQG